MRMKLVLLALILVILLTACDNNCIHNCTESCELHPPEGIDDVAAWCKADCEMRCTAQENSQ